MERPIKKAYVDSLIADKVAEGKTIEYKQQLPGGGDRDKLNFLATLCSLANTQGGNVLYGIVDERDADASPFLVKHSRPV